MSGRIDTVVIGAGQAGLAASHHLRRLGRDHVVLEQRRVAEAWRRRWDSFTLVTPNWSVRLPGAEYAGDQPDGFLPRDEIVAHLERYAADAPVRTGVKVEAVDPDPTTDGWRVTTSEGPMRARSVIVASGMFGKPRRPPMEAALATRILSIHTDDYRNPDALPPGGVLVVGTGQSGCQIAEELLEAGRDVSVSIGSAGRMRRRYRGRDSMAWAWDMGFFHRTIAALPDPKARFGANPYLSGKRGGHTINLHRLAANGLTLVGRLTAIDGERATFAPDVHDRLRGSDTFAQEFSTRIDEHIARAGVEAPEPTSENTDEHAGTEGFDQPILASLDLGDRGISTVIWAGGFAHDFSWVHAPVFDADAFPITTQGVTAAPGLAFLGLAFLYQFKSLLLSGVGDDAAHVVDTLAGNAVPA